MSPRLLNTLAMLCTGGGLIAGLIAFAATGRGIPALRLALEFWTAAGLIRLAGPPSWPQLGSAAAIVAVRQLISLGLRDSPLRRSSPAARAQPG